MIVEYDRELESLKIRHATPGEFANFVWPTNLESVHISGDYLDELYIPDGVVSVICTNLGLRKLTLPNSVELVYANGNNLRELTVPATIRNLELSYNPLYRLTFEGGDPLNMGNLTLRHSNISHLCFRVHEDCFIDAIGCRYLKYLTPETSFAVRSFFEYYLKEDGLMEEPEHWIVQKTI